MSILHYYPNVGGGTYCSPHTFDIGGANDPPLPSSSYAYDNICIHKNPIGNCTITANNIKSLSRLCVLNVHISIY